MLKRFLVACVLCFVVGTMVSCDGCGDDPRPADAGTAHKPPVPAPEGLVAKLVVGNPGATITALREAMGGGTLLVPRSVGGLVANLFGLPLQAAEHFDDNLPVVGAAVVSDAGAHVALAFHVRTPSAVIAVSTKGADAKFTSEKVGEAVVLVPTDKSIRKPRVGAVLGVVDNYFVASESRAGIAALGPYLARTLGQQKAGGVDVAIDLEDRAMGEAAKALHGLLGSAAQKIDLPPQLGAVVDLEGGVSTLTDTLGRLGGGRVEITLDDTALTLRGDFARAPDAFETKAAARPAALLALPDDVIAAATWAESSARRSATAEERAKALRAALAKSLGEAFTAEDSARITKALDGLARGRGDVSTMALRCTGMGLTGLATGAVADKKALDEALEILVGFRKSEAVRTALAAKKIEVSAKKTRILEVPDDMWRVRLKPEPAEKGELVEEIDLLAMVRDDRFFAAAGMQTVATLQHLHAPSDERSLKKKKRIDSAIRRVEQVVGDAVWLAVMVDAQGANACAVGKPGGALAAPVLVAIGPKDERVAAIIEVARPLLRVLAKSIVAL